jgi:UDP-glucuronate 4-epimerase
MVRPGEVLSHSFYKMFGLSVMIVRIFGPIRTTTRPYGMFHQRAINFVHNNTELQIYGKKGLDTAKDSTYIDDEVNGIIACLDCDYAFEVFNIGTSNPLPIRIWIDSIEQAFGKKATYKVVTVDKGDVVSSASIEKAQKMLSYNPLMDMYEGVKRQVEIFKLMPKWYQEMEV